MEFGPRLNIRQFFRRVFLFLYHHLSPSLIYVCLAVFCISGTAAPRRMPDMSVVSACFSMFQLFPRHTSVALGQTHEVCYLSLSLLCCVHLFSSLAAAGETATLQHSG